MPLIGKILISTNYSVLLRLFEIFEAHNEEIDNLPVLNRHRTVRFLAQGLEHLAGGYDCLDASRPWLVYWILHSLELLGETLTDQQELDQVLIAILYF